VIVSENHPKTGTGTSAARQVSVSDTHQSNASKENDVPASLFIGLVNKPVFSLPSSTARFMNIGSLQLCYCISWWWRDYPRGISEAWHVTLYNQARNG